MSKYSDPAKKLLDEYVRNTNLFPAFDQRNFNDILEEISQNHEDILKNTNNYNFCLTKHSKIEHNRRSLLVYKNERLKKLTALRSEFGSILPEEIQRNMTVDEKSYFEKLNSHLARLMQRGCFGLDLTSRSQPPQSLRVEVKCLQDHGEIFTTDGALKLFRGSRHFLLLEDCELLIKQGVLEHIP